MQMDTLLVSPLLSPEPDTAMLRNFKNNKYIIVSKIAYLIGVDKQRFESDQMPKLEIEIYNQLHSNRQAHIIRNLCRVRTAVEQNFKLIFENLNYHYKSIYQLPDLVPRDALNELSEDGISFSKSNQQPVQCIMEINGLISNRINNCKDLFPSWIKWEYIRELFIMPDGLREEGTKKAAALYYEHKSYYPYQIYINWNPTDEGNILYCDKKFVKLLYQWHQDEFTDDSKVTDAGEKTKEQIYDFLARSSKTMIMVDCENSDPYKLCAAIKNLDQNHLDKISKIVLYDDVNTSSTWKLINNYLPIPVEHILIERIKQNKSLVDIRLVGGVFREFFEHDVDSFIIASSDSDYWGLISELKEANFMVMVERKKCGPDIKMALENEDVFYCYLDHFYSGDTSDLKNSALINEIRHYIDETVHLNVSDMLNLAIHNTRADLSPEEKKQFYDQYIKRMQLVIQDDATVRIELRPK